MRHPQRAMTVLPVRAKEVETRASMAGCPHSGIRTDSLPQRRKMRGYCTRHTSKPTLTQRHCTRIGPLAKEGKVRNFNTPFSTEWLRRAEWCEQFEKDHPVDVARLEASYAVCMERIQNYGMACEMGWTEVKETLGVALHYQQRWYRIFRGRFPVSVEFLEGFAASWKLRSALETAVAFKND